jgi:hypothetical protein
MKIDVRFPLASRPWRVSPSMTNLAVPCAFMKELSLTAIALPRTRAEAMTVAFAVTVTSEISQ